MGNGKQHEYVRIYASFEVHENRNKIEKEFNIELPDEQLS